MHFLFITWDDFECHLFFGMMFKQYIYRFGR